MANDGDKLPVGTRVRHVDTGECGVVVHCWYREDLACYDCHVAFVGQELPGGELAEKPYVLRYLASSLTILQGPHTGIPRRLPEELILQPLQAVTALVFDAPDEIAPPVREAISFRFATGQVVLQSLTDTSELRVDTTAITVPDAPEYRGCYTIADLSLDAVFAASVGEPLNGWWWMTNHAGYDDGFVISFGTNSAICFVAINNGISVLPASGDQCS